ncbi:hypothetical protein DFJ73DRAFT_835403 [Zopfochytrium polystomum]|nr:hypothetical protein DFJ73DRAFT_835403 [Zopfochytrium polystomum]
MYIHGGGCVVGTPWFFVDHHALLVERFDAMRRDRLNGRDDGGSGAEGLAVFSPDYPLAPEHRHPAAVEAVFEAYCWLVDEVGVEEVFVGECKLYMCVCASVFVRVG